MMKKRHAALLLCSTLLLGACGSTNVSTAVKTTCNASLEGMNMTIVLEAPAEDKDITSMEMNMEMPFSMIQEQAGIELDDEQIEEAIEQAKTAYGAVLSNMLGIEKEDIDMSVKDKNLVFSIKLKDMDKIRKLVEDMTPEGEETPEMDFTFSAMKKELSTNATCD